MRTICKNCGGDNWYNPYNTKTARCENCNYERPYYKRQAKVSKITPSQLEAVERIKELCKSWSLSKEIETKTELTSYGDLTVAIISIEDNVFSRLSVYCFVGRRGGIKVSRADRGLRDKTKHFQKHLVK